jgi:hypothetical protein
MSWLSELFGSKRKIKRNFPVWAKDLCLRELEHMRVALSSKGAKLKEHDLTVIFHKDSWYVKEPSWKNGGAQVNAITWGTGKTIECSCREIGNAGTIHVGSLAHEMAHHWLITNGLGGGHPAMFDAVVPGWREARRIIGK